MRLPSSMHIAAREAQGLLWSPSGALIVGSFWVSAGLIFMLVLSRFREALILTARQPNLQAGPAGLHINDWVIAETFNYTGGVLLILFVPLLTMRSFAEERRTGNLELLMSQPLSGSDLLIGKVGGAFLALIGCFSIFLIQAGILAWITTPDWPAALVGLLGLTLTGFLFVSFGTLVSILTRSPIEAAVLSMGGLLILLTGPNMVSSAPRWLRDAIEFLSVESRFRTLTSGILDMGDVAFLLGASLILLAVALRGLDLVRWQG